MAGGKNGGKMNENILKNIDFLSLYKEYMDLRESEEDEEDRA
jgi:hypothetical protein